MKPIWSLLILLLAVLAVVSLSPAQQRTIEGKGEEYHHSMILNFKHAAEEAEALFAQVSLPRAMNLEIAKEHVDEIWGNLEHARIEHAMIHKTYGSDESRITADNHSNLLLAHTKAVDACKLIKDEIAKSEPNTEVIKTQAMVVYQQCLKAAELHTDTIKKLGITEMKVAS